MKFRNKPPNFCLLSFFRKNWLVNKSESEQQFLRPNIIFKINKKNVKNEKLTKKTFSENHFKYFFTEIYYFYFILILLKYLKLSKLRKELDLNRPVINCYFDSNSMKNSTVWHLFDKIQLFLSSTTNCWRKTSKQETFGIF